MRSLRPQASEYSLCLASYSIEHQGRLSILNLRKAKCWRLKKWPAAEPEETKVTMPTCSVELLFVESTMITVFVCLRIILLFK